MNHEDRIEPASCAEKKDRENNSSVLWQALSAAGNRQLSAFRTEITKIAPNPGTLVIVQARNLRRTAGTFDSLLLSAIDTRTHLQVARMYFVSSLAATIDFFEYFIRTFPFSIKEARTYDDLNKGTHDLDGHRFAMAAYRCGIGHRNVHAAKGDALSMLERYFYPESDMAPLEEKSENEQSARLRQFLFFHNNQRSLPTLGGDTPLETLRRFPGFKDTVAFDPE